MGHPVIGGRDPAEQPPSRQGFSVGHWEDENTLVIHTSRINFPYLGSTGIPLSEELSVVERYTLSEDQARLDRCLTVCTLVYAASPALAVSSINFRCLMRRSSSARKILIPDFTTVGSLDFTRSVQAL